MTSLRSTVSSCGGESVRDVFTTSSPSLTAHTVTAGWQVITGDIAQETRAGCTGLYGRRPSVQVTTCNSDWLVRYFLTSDVESSVWTFTSDVTSGCSTNQHRTSERSERYTLTYPIPPVFKSSWVNGLWGELILIDRTTERADTARGETNWKKVDGLIGARNWSVPHYTGSKTTLLPTEILARQS